MKIRCSICKVKIPKGVSYVSVDMHKEMVIGKNVYVQDASQLAVFCTECFNAPGIDEITIDVKKGKGQQI